MPCERDILEVQEDQSRSCDSRITPGSCERTGQDVAQVHSRCSSGRDHGCGEHDGFQRQTSRRSHIEGETEKINRRRQETKIESTDMNIIFGRTSHAHKDTHTLSLSLLSLSQASGRSFWPKPPT